MGAAPTDAAEMPLGESSQSPHQLQRGVRQSPMAGGSHLEIKTLG